MQKKRKYTEELTLQSTLAKLSNRFEITFTKTSLSTGDFETAANLFSFNTNKRTSITINNPKLKE